MYGIEKSVDLHFLVDRELLQLCVGSYQVILNFTDEIVITIESKCELVESSSSFRISCNEPSQSKELVCLLGSTITKAINHGAGELHLVFSNGYLLKLIDDNEETESYTIVTVDHEIIV